MNRRISDILTLVSLLGIAMSARAQATYTIFDFPGSTLDSYTTLSGINDRGIIVGFENTTGFPRGFVRATDGSVTSVNIPAPGGGPAFGNIVDGINSRGQMVGEVSSIIGGVFHGTGFVTSGGGVTYFEVPGARSTFARGINDAGVIVGGYIDSGFRQHGFVRDKAGGLSLFDVPGSVVTSLTGVNNQGQIVGWFADANFVGHGVLLDRSGAITVIDAPGTTYTTGLSCINDRGEIVGWADARGFVRSANGVFRFFDIGSSDTFCSAINNRGTIVGGIDDDFTTHGLIIR